MSAIKSEVNEFARGWTVLFAAFLGIGVSVVSIVFYSNGIWVRPWQEAFGWTRAEIGGAQTVGTIVIVLMAPIAGRIIDQFGLRLVSTLSLILYAGGLYAVSQMNGSIWVFYALVALYTAVGVASTPLAFTRAVNAWFNKNRGLALGLSLMSTGVAGAALPAFLTPYVAENGWRAGYLILVIIVLVATPVIWLLIRDHPPQADGEEGAAAASSGVETSDALHLRSFWTLGLIFLMIALAVCGLIPNFIPLLQDAGLTPEAAGAYFGIVGVSVMLGRLLTGFLVDRIFAPYVMAVVFTLVAAGVLSLAIGGVAMAPIAAVALGFAIGAEVDLIGYFTARYYGMKNYSAIFGFQYGFFSLGCAASPLIAGYIWDTTGNYDLALYGASILLIGAVLLTMTLPRFQDEPNRVAAA